MSADLIAFAEARLAEDEAVARGATRGPWTSTGNSSIRDVDGELVVASVAGRGLWPSATDAVHIARHDPARALREVEAKRHILARRRLVANGEPSLVSSFQRGQDAGYVEACDEALRDLATAWSDHPDYRQEWAP